MLGNGLRVVMGAVAAHHGSIAITTRGQRIVLRVDPVSGKSEIVSQQPESLGSNIGTSIEIKLPNFDGSEWGYASHSIEVAGLGQDYDGPSHPSWYGASALHELCCRVTPAETTVGVVIGDVFGMAYQDERCARDLSPEDADALHRELCRMVPPFAPEHIGHIGEAESLGEFYHRCFGTAALSDESRIASAYVTCEHASKDGRTRGRLSLLLNVRRRSRRGISAPTAPGCTSGPPVTRSIFPAPSAAITR